MSNRKIQSGSRKLATKARRPVRRDMGDFVLRKMDLIIGRISALESGRASTDFVNKLREDLNLRTQDLAAMSKRDCDRADAVSSINEQMTRAFGRIISLESRP